MHTGGTVLYFFAFFKYNDFMRRARITWKGAYHHVMNRGYDGNPIFSKNSDKEIFLDMLKINSEKLRIRIFAYCIMDNHYHLILENSSGRMSDFFKQLNGNYGSYYRKNHGGKGYVFQNRYKSMLIQNDSYLILAIAYIMKNPVRARIVNDVLKYDWSSASLIFAEKKGKQFNKSTVDIGYLEELFETEENYLRIVKSLDVESLPIIGTKVGRIIGGEEFVIKAMKKYERRSPKESLERKRINDKYFDPIEKIIMEFEMKHKVMITKIDTSTFFGKKLRGEFLYSLRENGGLKYGEIVKMDIFSDLKINSLGALYKRTKERLNRK